MDESPAPPHVRSPASAGVLTATYSVLVVTAYMSVGLLSLLGMRRSPGVLYAVLILITLTLYVHLARSQPAYFVRVASGAAIIGSALCSAVNSLAVTSSPLKVFTVMLVLNIVMASLAGTLFALKQLKPPANNRIWTPPASGRDNQG
jgi:threonine/homoserine efflux transporter RhtA